MKKAACILLFLLPALVTEAALVDDFESYATGPITQVTAGKWVPVFGNAGTDPGADSAVRSIAADPTDAGNQVVYIETTNAGQYSMYCILPASSVITDNTTKTFYFRFYATTNAIDQSLGLTSVDAPVNFANFNSQMALVRGNVLVRNAGANTDVGDFVANTWYYVWIVVNNTTNTSTVYMKSTAADATVSDRIALNYAFRTAGTSNPDGDIDRFLTVANYGPNITSGTRVHFDDMTVSAGEDLTLPSSTKPYNPNVVQAADAVNHDINVTMQWNAGRDPAEVYAVNPAIVNQYVFVGSGIDPNLYYKGATNADPENTPASTFGPADLVPGTQYRWAVVEAISGYEQTFTAGVSEITAVDANNIVGPTWNFTTILLVPMFDGEPLDQWVFANSAATFSVSVLDDNGVSYQWYKGSTPLTDISGKISGSQTSTLTISDAQAADEGSYSCRATNSAGSSDSAAGILYIKRLKSHYPLESDVLDAVSDFDMTLAGEDAAGVPTLVSGAVSPVVGSYSLQLDNGDTATDPNGQYATLPAGVVDYPDITISTWIKWDGGAAWQRLFDFGVDTSHYMFLTPSHGSECRFVLNSGSGEQIVSTTPLTSGEWVFVAATVEGNTGTLYVNGESKATNTSVTINPIDIAATLNYIGKSQYAADAEFDGLIDDFKIYNYAVDEVAIAKEYYDATGKDPCVYPTFDGSTFNLDNTGTSYCIVDVADLAAFAAQWLNDGLADLP